MSAADAFAEFDRHRPAPLAQGHASEYRCLVARLIAPTSTARSWQRIHTIYELRSRQADAYGHTCGTHDCAPCSMLAGETFVDPADRAAHRQVASGHVWVCTKSFHRHVCNETDCCAYTVYDRRGLGGTCLMTGLAKRAAIVSTTQTVQADVYSAIAYSSTVDATPARDADALPKAAKRPPPRRPVRRARPTVDGRAAPQPAELLSSMAPLSATRDQVLAICRVLMVGDTSVARESVRFLAAAVARLGAVPRAEAAIDTLSAVYKAVHAELDMALALAPALYCQIADADLLYLADSVARLLSTVLLTPKMTARDNAASAKGLSPVDAVVPLLVTLRDGLVAIEYADIGDFELLTVRQADRLEMARADKPRRRTVFVPEHPHLRHVIVDALPHGVTSPALDAYFAHTMATRGTILAAFSSVISRGTGDPALYCLRATALRPDVLSTISLLWGGCAPPGPPATGQVPERAPTEAQAETEAPALAPVAPSLSVTTPSTSLSAVATAHEAGGLQAPRRRAIFFGPPP